MMMLGKVEHPMRFCIKAGLAILLAGFLLGLPNAHAQAATVAPVAGTRLCGVAQPYGQATSRVYYLYDPRSNYSYGYRLTLGLWKDRCPLAFGVAQVQSFDGKAPSGNLSVSVYDCDTKLGGYTRTVQTPAGAGITAVTSRNVPVGPYYFVQVFYDNGSGTSNGEIVFQTGACVATP
jgi:hypothetical protein